jgi:hypothetical protein
LLMSLPTRGRRVAAERAGHRRERRAMNTDMDRLVDAMASAWERARLYEELAEQAIEEGAIAEVLARQSGISLDELMARVEKRYCAP